MDVGRNLATLDLPKGLPLTMETTATATAERFTVCRVSASVYWVVDTQPVKPAETGQPVPLAGIFPTRKAARQFAAERNQLVSQPAFWILAYPVNGYSRELTYTRVGHRADVLAYVQSDNQYASVTEWFSTDAPDPSTGLRTDYWLWPLPANSPIYRVDTPDGTPVDIAHIRRITSSTTQTPDYTHTVETAVELAQYVHRVQSGIYPYLSVTAIYPDGTEDRRPHASRSNHVLPVSGYRLTARTTDTEPDCSRYIVRESDDYNSRYHWQLEFSDKPGQLVHDVWTIRLAQSTPYRFSGRFDSTTCPDLYTTCYPSAPPVTTPPQSVSVLSGETIANSRASKTPLRVFTGETAETDALAYARQTVTTNPNSPAYVCRDWQWPLPESTSLNRYLDTNQLAYVLPPVGRGTDRGYSGIAVFDDGVLPDVLYTASDNHRLPEDIRELANAIRHSLLRTVKGINIRVTDDGKLDYYPADKPLVVTTRDNPAVFCRTAPARVTAKLVKGLRACFPELTAIHQPAAWEQLGNLIKAGLAHDGQFQLVSGDDIPHWYARSRMSPNARVGSCMAKDSSFTRRVMPLYARNPTVCQLLILTDDDGLLGRALVWTTADGRKVCDRAYGSEVVCRAIYRYATEQLGCTATYQTELSGETIQLTEWQFSYYPYLDSFRYLDMADGQLSTYCPDGWYRELASTDGSYEDSGEDGPTWRVTLSRTLIETAYITVTAATAEDAQEQAEAMRDRDVSDWSIGTSPSDSWTVDDVERED